MKYNILEKFMPPQYNNSRLDILELNQHFGREMNYASDGKSALYQILKELKVRKKVLVPAYVCSSILHPLLKLGINYKCYDLDESDLNASIKSIEEILNEEHDIEACIVASMYGNPANLTEIEELCKKKNIILIDDAAQSMGASLDGRPVGSFGDAGFFSFACGKPLVAHMGAFFWIRDYVAVKSKLKTRKHIAFHKFTYYDYKLNRVKRYQNGERYYIMSLIRLLWWKIIDISHDSMPRFEDGILGGALRGLYIGSYDFRKKWTKQFAEKISKGNRLRLITNQRGYSHPHKLVFVTKTAELADCLIRTMHSRGIFCCSGYPIIKSKLDSTTCASAESLVKKIVEFPIENDNDKMAYLLKTIEQFDDEGGV